MLKFGKGVVKYRIPILILSFLLLIPSAFGYFKTRINYDILYYLPQDIIDLLNIKAAKERKSKSEIVLEGLRYVLREELKESKKSSAEKEEVI